MMAQLDRERQMIAILEKIAQTGSISMTAETLYLSQPTVSKLIRKQEQQYGATLIDRDSHPLRLTYAGKFYLAQMQNLTKSLAVVTNQLRSYADANVARLSIGVTQSLGSELLPQILPSFHAVYPEVRLQLVEYPSEAAEQALMNGDIDIYMGVALTYDPSLRYELLYHEPVCLVLPKALYPEPPAVTTITDASPLIAHQDLILETADSGFQRLIAGYLAKHNLQPNIVLRTANLITAKRLATAGMGAAFVPQSAIDDRINEAEVTILTFDSSELQLDISMAFSRRTSMTSVMRHFLALTNNLFQSSTTSYSLRGGVDS